MPLCASAMFVGMVNPVGNAVALVSIWMPVGGPMKPWGGPANPDGGVKPGGKPCMLVGAPLAPTGGPLGKAVGIWAGEIDGGSAVPESRDAGGAP